MRVRLEKRRDEVVALEAHRGEPRDLLRKRPRPRARSVRLARRREPKHDRVGAFGERAKRSALRRRLDAVDRIERHDHARRAIRSAPEVRRHRGRQRIARLEARAGEGGAQQPRHMLREAAHIAEAPLGALLERGRRARAPRQRPDRAQQVGVRRVLERQRVVFLEDARHRAAHMRAPVADAIVERDSAALRQRRERKAQVSDHRVLEVQPVHEHKLERPVRTADLGPHHAHRHIVEREGRANREPALVEVDPRLEPKPRRGEPRDLERPAREIRATAMRAHRGELDIERQVRVDRMHLGARQRLRHQERARADERADLEHAPRTRALRECPEIRHIGCRKRPLGHRRAWISERLVDLEDSREFSVAAERGVAHCGECITAERRARCGLRQGISSSVALTMSHAPLALVKKPPP